MLKVFPRHAAPWACAWMLGLPAAHAAPAAPPAQALTAPFARYQAWREAPLVDWREANDRVRAIGGWRAYARESQPDGDAADHGGHAAPAPDGEGHP